MCTCVVIRKESGFVSIYRRIRVVLKCGNKFFIEIYWISNLLLVMERSVLIENENKKKNLTFDPLQRVIFLTKVTAIVSVALERILHLTF